MKMIQGILCKLGWHRYEQENLGEGVVRVCAHCDKQQYWASAGFPDHYGEWRNL